MTYPGGRVRCALIASDAVDTRLRLINYAPFQSLVRHTHTVFDSASVVCRRGTLKLLLESNRNRSLGCQQREPSTIWHENEINKKACDAHIRRTHQLIEPLTKE